MKPRSKKQLKKTEYVTFVKDVRKAIKLDCYDCMGGQVLTDCGNKTCKLFYYRPWNKTCKWPKQIDKPVKSIVAV